MTTRTFPAALVDTLARCAHEANYIARGERYADPAEMDMHRDDPCAFWEMVSAQVVAALGLDPAAYGPKDAWRDGDQFVFQNWNDRMEADAEEVAETLAQEEDAAWANAPLPEAAPSLRSRLTIDPEAVAIFSTWAAARDAGTELYNAFSGQVSTTWGEDDGEWIVRAFDTKDGAFMGFLRSAYADRGYEA